MPVSAGSAAFFAPYIFKTVPKVFWNLGRTSFLVWSNRTILPCEGAQFNRGKKKVSMTLYSTIIPEMKSSKLDSSGFECSIDLFEFLLHVSQIQLDLLNTSIFIGTRQCSDKKLFGFCIILGAGQKDARYIEQLCIATGHQDCFHKC